MNRLCWRIANLVLLLVEPDEREIVRGDLQEAGASGAYALREIIGLAGRRQVIAWMTWRPWVALATLILPFGMLLSVVARSWAYGSAIYAWLYVDNWTWAYLESAGSRAELLGRGSQALLAFSAVAVWSWACGFVVASIARRAAWTSGVVFCAVVFAQFGPVSHVAEQHQAVFSLTFYRDVFPGLVQSVLVLIPSICGMWIGVRRATLPRRRAVAIAGALVAVTLLTLRGLETATAGWLNTRSTWLHLVPVLIVWPAVYILVTSREMPRCDSISRSRLR
jgi:hypothetical protein